MRMPDLKLAHHKAFLWILAFVITLSSAVYQRLTGPTYPVRGTEMFAGTEACYRFPRSESVGKDVEVAVSVVDQAVTATVRYRRYKSEDSWSELAMERKGDSLLANLPEQPAAGKLMYLVNLSKDEKTHALAGGEPIILRYKGAVPGTVLLPHIIFMFLAMLVGNRAAFEALDSRGRSKTYMLWTIGLFGIGGLILGPIVQKYAFDAYWTGIPFGHDLTDNKVLIAMAVWLWAWWTNRGDRRNRGWIFIAGLVQLAIYLIPHSTLGSEIDYTKSTQK